MPDPADFETEADALTDEQAGGYRPRSGLSIAGLLLGIASATVFLHPYMLAVAALGTLVNLLALRRISRFWPDLAGWRTALVGLSLSVIFGAGAAGYELVDRWRARVEGQRFATQWFEFLRQVEPEKAHHLTLTPDVRQPLDDRLRTVYMANPYRRQALEEFVAKPEVRTLLALGERASVRFYETEGQQAHGSGQALALSYAVTFKEAVAFEQEGRKKTFFVLVALTLASNEKTGQPAWTIVAFKGGHRPRSWPEETAEPTEPTGD